MFLFGKNGAYGKAFRGRLGADNAIEICGIYQFFQPLLIFTSKNATMHLQPQQNEDGQVWITTRNGLYFLKNDTLSLFHDFKALKYRYSGTKTLTWSVAGTGLIRYDPGSKVLDTLSKLEENEEIIAYYIDDYYNTWYSTGMNGANKDGLFLCYPTPEYFSHYLNENDTKESYSINALIKDKKGNIWAGGRPGNHIFKISADGSIIKIPVPFQQSGLNDIPRNVAEDDQGFLWFAFLENYFFRLDPQTGQFTDYSNQGILREEFNQHPFYRLVKYLGDNEIITCGGGCISIRNTISGAVKSMKLPESHQIYSIYKDEMDKLWLGLNGKILEIDRNLADYKLFSLGNGIYNVEDICPGDSSDLWLATLGGGLRNFSMKDHSVQSFSTIDGLAHNTLYSIEKDNAGNLWISHDLGISMMNPKTNVFVNYNEKDGLLIREFNSEADFQTLEGEIMFGGVDGIVSFFPENVKKSRSGSPWRLMISGLKVSDQPVSTEKPIFEMTCVELGKGTNNFQVEFVRPDFRYGEEIQYRFRLKNSQKEWMLTDSKHRWVNFTNLKPGNYEFEVQCTGLYGEWDYHADLTIYLQPYFYQTIYFKILLAAVFQGFLLFAFYMRLKQVRLAEWRTYEKMKLETLHSQMNPHFVFNALNSINFFIIRNDVVQANQYITNLSRLMRDILINSSRDYIPLGSEIQALQHYISLEHDQCHDKFDYDITIDSSIDEESTEVTPFLIQPFVENSIKHGLKPLMNRKGHLDIRFEWKTGDTLVCIIEDDGVGRGMSISKKTADQQNRRSRGIEIVQERLDIINKLFKKNYKFIITDLFDDREETGTKIRIELPLKDIFL
jgi:ligand-binding sensor domain-containing protein